MLKCKSSEIVGEKNVYKRVRLWGGCGMWGKEINGDVKLDR